MLPYALRVNRPVLESQCLMLNGRHSDISWHAAFRHYHKPRLAGPVTDALLGAANLSKTRHSNMHNATAFAMSMTLRPEGVPARKLHTKATPIHIHTTDRSVCRGSEPACDIILPT